MLNTKAREYRDKAREADKTADTADKPDGLTSRSAGNGQPPFETELDCSLIRCPF
jgi:hypothetical protein